MSLVPFYGWWLSRVKSFSQSFFSINHQPRVIYFLFNESIIPRYFGWEQKYSQIVSVHCVPPAWSVGIGIIHGAPLTPTVTSASLKSGGGGGGGACRARLTIWFPRRRERRTSCLSVLGRGVSLEVWRLRSGGRRMLERRRSGEIDWMEIKLPEWHSGLTAQMRAHKAQKSFCRLIAVRMSWLCNEPPDSASSRPSLPRTTYHTAEGTFTVCSLHNVQMYQRTAARRGLNLL